MASTPRSNIPRAMRSVIPTPPAEFSPFTTTKSGACCSLSPGSSDSRARRPGPPTTSLTNSSLTLRDSFSLPATVAAMHRPAAAAEPASGPASGGPVLEARDLVKRFGDRTALRGVTISARRGELVAVIGPNGAGKTTLLSILAGIQRADSGSISKSPGEIGWGPPQAALYKKLTVAENLRLFARLERRDDPEATVEQMLEQTGLGDRADDQVHTLSGGNRQRVNIAIGLLSEPEVLLLDEPSAALDPRQRDRLWEFILDLAERGTSVLYSPHIGPEAEGYATQVVVLADGEVLFTGTPHELEQAVEGSDRRAPDFEAA